MGKEKASAAMFIKACFAGGRVDEAKDSCEIEIWLARLWLGWAGEDVCVDK